jgi:hypothetical protein
MKFRWLLIVLLNISVAYAQQVHLQGYVVDAQTGLPVGEATIGVSEKNLFYPTNSKGEFDISDGKIAQTDSISVSCIGYQTQKIKAVDFKTEAVIKLLVLVKVLREVKIGLIQCGSRVNKQDVWTAYWPLNEEAMFMTASKNAKGTVQSVGFYLGNAQGGDAIAPFRVKIYDVDAHGMPGKELTKDILIVSAKKNNAWFDVDLSDYNISNPPGGFFVVFCLIDATNYQANLKIEMGSDIVTPRLGMTEHEFNAQHSYRGENKHGKMKWQEEQFTDNYMIRATIVPE